MTQQSMPAGGVDALFDLSFSRFITIGFIKVIYILGMVALGLGWLGLVATAFMQGFLAGVFAMVFATVVLVLYLIFLRVSLELVVVIFRIGENTSALALHQGAIGTGGFPVQSLGTPPGVI